MCLYFGGFHSAVSVYDPLVWWFCFECVFVCPFISVILLLCFMCWVYFCVALVVVVYGGLCGLFMWFMFCGLVVCSFMFGGFLVVV